MYRDLGHEEEIKRGADESFWELALSTIAAVKD
jgi:hypothetical protein